MGEGGNEEGQQKARSGLLRVGQGGIIKRHNPGGVCGGGYFLIFILFFSRVALIFVRSGIYVN